MKAVEEYLRLTFGGKFPLNHVADSYIRGKKSVIILTFKYANDTHKIIAERKKLKKDLDSTRNNSLQRVLSRDHQKIFSLLIDKVKLRQLADVSVTKSGFISVSKGTEYRTILDINEAHYIIQNSDLEIEEFAKLKDPGYFVNSNFKLVKTPVKFQREF